nr:PepSY domain-containing protein [Sphingomonas sp. Y57]
MSPAAQRLLYALHRWGGVALCILFALWFITGIILMYVGFPKLTQAERLSSLGDITTVNCCVPLESVLSDRRFSGRPSSIQVLVVGGRPIYRLGFGKSFQRVDARTGEVLPAVNREEALAIAARLFPGATGTYDGLIDQDQWTYTMRFAAHRPIHRIQMNDPARTLLYLSSRTGEVVRDAPLAERRWAYAGAWLHWLYMFKTEYADPKWELAVSLLCLVGIGLVITGVWIGVTRWKFRGRYKSGRKTPYVQPMQRWHHVGGLLFAFFALTWLISGLASVNPLGVFDRKATADREAFQGGALTADRFTLSGSTALAKLGPTFVPRQLDWVSIGGSPYLIATNSRNDVRVLPASGAAVTVQPRLPEASIRAAAEKLVVGGSLTTLELLADYDNHYYPRAQHTLRGDENRRLPVFRATYSDPARSTAYIDAHTGEIVAHYDATTRLYRWVFSFMHSWDAGMLLRTRPSWDFILLLLSVGGLVISFTGLVLAKRRLAFTAQKRKQRRRLR